MIIKEQLQHKINQKTKPIGSLGLLETVALQIGCIQQTTTPQINQPHIIVFAADHGIAASGNVNPYPQAVTAQMVLNFTQGGAAINTFCKQNQIELTVVDAGVNVHFDPALPIKHYKIDNGTNDYTTQYAMTEAQLNKALEKGAELVEEVHSMGCNCIGFGEMGIGNTSSAALIMHHYTGLSMEACVGRGTGANDEQLQLKIKTLQNAADFHRLAHTEMSAAELMQRVAGFELVMMAGAYIKAYELGMVIVVDGFIATAALYLALKHYHQPQEETKTISNKSVILNNCIFAHQSNENGHRKMLELINGTPLLQIGLRLGEGTGAALAIPLLRNACAFVNEMASFESAGIDGSTQ
jgi:nicotinate-nucleotide--dimethylbenzimidazole phosphoribosyltransferase